MTNAPELGLRNIGPETEAWLKRIGITHKNQFEKLGAEKTYLLLLEAGHEPSQSLRYMLIGAEEDIDWHLIAEREQYSENSRLADLDEP